MDNLHITTLLHRPLVLYAGSWWTYAFTLQPQQAAGVSITTDSCEPGSEVPAPSPSYQLQKYRLHRSEELLHPFSSSTIAVTFILMPASPLGSYYSSRPVTPVHPLINQDYRSHYPSNGVRFSGYWYSSDGDDFGGLDTRV